MIVVLEVARKERSKRTRFNSNIFAVLIFDILITFDIFFIRPWLTLAIILFNCMQSSQTFEGGKHQSRF